MVTEYEPFQSLKERRCPMVFVFVCETGGIIL